MKMISIFLVALLSLLTGCQTTTSDPVAYSEDSESDIFDPETFKRYDSIVVAAGTPEKPVDMRLWYARPDKLEADTPVVMVMHGGRRDADVYRDYWGAYAEEYDVLIVAPEISKADFPTGWGYQTGNWVTPTRPLWTKPKGSAIHRSSLPLPPWSGHSTSCGMPLLLRPPSTIYGAMVAAPSSSPAW